MDRLRRVAKVLGVKTSDLLGIDDEGNDLDVIDSVEKFFVWLSQVQYQITVNARRAIEGELARRMADEQVARQKPARHETKGDTGQVLRHRARGEQRSGG